MTDKRISEYTALAGASIATGDLFEMVDVSDTTDAATGTNKKTTAGDIATAVGTLLSLASTYQPLDSDLTALAAAGNSATLANVTAAYTTAEASKLAGIEAAADVTDATNVSAAGAAMISSGAGAPGSTPAKVGNIYIDTTGDRIYIATDTASSADWDLVPITAAQILALLITVDGSGSGLDADLLDGNEATAFQSADATLTALAGVTTAADKLIYATGSDAFATTDLTSTARSLLDDTSTSAMRTTLGLAIGTDVQAQDTELAALAGLTSAADRVPYFTGSGTAALATFTAAGRALVDDADAAAQRTTLGLGTMAVEAAASYLPLAAGGASVENVGAIESNVNTVATTGATETLDFSLYAVHDCTMDQNCTFTFSNPAPSGKATIVTVIVRGAFTPTFPASVDWGDATPPTYSTPTQYVFTTVDAGTTYLGQSVAKALG